MMGGEDSHVVFGQNFPGGKGNVHCRDARASSFVAKVRGEVSDFYAVTVKGHGSVWNLLFGLPGQILYEQSP
jgi:hypothetical protein